MSRRVQPIVEEFDDDTDLPLPSRPLPNTGAKGALLQSVDSESEDDDDDPNVYGMPSNPFNPGLASPSQLGQFNIPPQMRGEEGHGRVSDLTPYKKWTCIYPIYIDAKRPFGPGCRRIARAKAVWWPLSKDIADAATRLGLGTLHEVQKCHPRDWENPGRVRVQWKRDGKVVNERIKSKKQLLEAISFYIQTVKPELIPKPPFSNSSNITPTPSENPSAATTASKAPVGASKAKQQPAKSKGKTKAEKSTKQELVHKPRLPQPPEPLPPLANRLSSYSPALPSGVLVDTIKAGMSAPSGDNAIGGPAGGGKGKRKVVRVRG